MKKVACFAVLLSLVAAPAFGQKGFETAPIDGKMKVYLQNSGGDADSAGLADLITRALDKSRTLSLIPIAEDSAVKVRAPISMLKDEGGSRVTVTFEVTPPRRDDAHVYKVACPTIQLYRCAEDIAARAERVAKTGF